MSSRGSSDSRPQSLSKRTYSFRLRLVAVCGRHVVLTHRSNTRRSPPRRQDRARPPPSIQNVEHHQPGRATRATVPRARGTATWWLDYEKQNPTLGDENWACVSGACCANSDRIHGSSRVAHHRSWCQSLKHFPKIEDGQPLYCRELL